MMAITTTNSTSVKPLDRRRRRVGRVQAAMLVKIDCV
jgi:hypothetical protein